MKNNASHPLKIVQGEIAPSSKTLPLHEAAVRRQENALGMEREWEQDPTQFDPEKTAIGRERLKRTWEAILQARSPLPSKALDLGCGFGALAKMLEEQGVNVTVADIAKKPLRFLDPQTFEIVQTALPKTTLPDQAFDLVVCTDVIAYLPPQDFRLALSELERLLKPDGVIICSTPLDFRSDDALARFSNLMETEFQPVGWIFSYHALYLRFLSFLKGPATFLKGVEDPAFRKKVTSLPKHPWQRKIKEWMTSPFMRFFWLPLAFVLSPLVNRWEQSSFLLLFFEKGCRFFYGKRGISHALFIGIRKPLQSLYPPSALPERPPFKRERKWE